LTWHRIGRTARAGKEGKAINILSSRDYDDFRRVERDYEVDVIEEKMPEINRVKIKWTETPSPKDRRGLKKRGYSSGWQGVKRQNRR
jgi:superfamily II DNA/RNA helicase